MIDLQRERYAIRIGLITLGSVAWALFCLWLWVHFIRWAVR